MKKRRSPYLRVLAWSCVALSALVIAFNVVIDPYGYFRLAAIPGINVKKPRPDIDMVEIKAAGVRAVKPDALILGNSRAEVGFDPEHPGFLRRGLTAYNFSIPGSDLETSWRQLKDDVPFPRPKLVVLGLDFQDFLIDPAADSMGHPDPAPQSAWASLRKRLQAAYTLSALVDSITTVLIQSRPYAATLTARGFNPMRDYVPITRIDGWHALFRHKAEGVARSLVTLPKSVLAHGADRSPPLDLVRKIVRTSLAQGTELHLVIYPYHSQLLTLYDAAGLWPAFEEWKRRVVDIVAAEKASVSGPGKVVLWDFSGFHRYALEPVPSKEDRTVDMRWYWEAAHFRKELGDLILDRILSGVATAEGFGLPLVPENVEPQIERMRQGRERLKTDDPDLVSDSRAMIDKAQAAARKGSNLPGVTFKQ